MAAEPVAQVVRRRVAAGMVYEVARAVMAYAVVIVGGVVIVVQVQF